MTRLCPSIGSHNQVQYKARRCYNAGLDLPLAKGWLWRHESGTLPPRRSTDVLLSRDEPMLGVGKALD